MRGYVEVVDSFQVSGWCLEAENQLPDRVVICVDDEEVAQVPCHLLRSHLRRPKVSLTGEGLGTEGRLARCGWTTLSK